MSRSVVRLASIRSAGTSRSTSVAIASQGIEIVDQLPSARRQEQAIGATVARIWPTLEQAVLDQTIEQAHQRDRLQLELVGQIDLRQPLLRTQPEQHDPLRARRAARLGTMIDVVAQQTRAFDELRNQLTLQIERHDITSKRLNVSICF